MNHARDERRYIRAVEAAWAKLLGRPALISPREFETIDAWRRRGIPLSIVLEVIGAAGKRLSGKAPRALTSIAGTVEDAWAPVAAGRTAREVADNRPARGDALSAWEEAVSRAPEHAPLRGMLARLLSEARAGVDAATLDADLDRSLPEVVSDDLLERTRKDTTGELRSFRPRMNDAEYQALFTRALIDKLRAALVLPRLALTR